MYCGDISSDQYNQVKELLESRVREAAVRGWFPSEGAQVLNEASVIDTDGSVYRPDRVVKTGRSVIIVDYKFGEHNSRYERQMNRYMQLWTRMGYEDVSAYLWYVQTGEVVPVQASL